MQSELKTIPHIITKKVLIQMYLNQLPEATIRNGINVIICDNRKNESGFKVVGKMPSVQKIREREFREFMAVYGAPKGYKVDNLI